MFTNVSEVCTASIIRAMMEEVQTSESLVNSCQSTLSYNPEDSHNQKIVTFLFLITFPAYLPEPISLYHSLP
jgi:hypothetical protein